MNLKIFRRNSLPKAKPFNPQRRISPLNHVKTKILVWKDNHINIKGIFKILMPFLVVLVILPFILFYSVYIGYQNRVVKEVKDLPSEITTTVIVTTHNVELFKQFAKSAEDLYFTRQANKIYIFILPNTSEEVLPKDKIYTFLKDIPKDNITIDNTVQDNYQVCNKISDELKLNKIFLIGTNLNLLRTSYICNNKGVYAVAFDPVQEEIISPDAFTRIIKDIIHLNFNI